MWNQLNGSEQRPGWVRTQTPDSGAGLVLRTGAVQERQGAAGLVLTFVQTRSAHWYIGPAATLPAQPAAALRSPVMERPRNHTALLPALTTTLIDYSAFFWITVKCLSPCLHFVVTSPPVIILWLAVFTWSASVLARQDSTEWPDCPRTN